MSQDRDRKLCVIGDHRVGKTSVVRRLTGIDHEHAPGIQLSRWRGPNGGGGFQIWDIDGKSVLDTLNQTFLSGVDGFVVVADASRPDSVRMGQIALTHARRLVGNKPAVLLLNKCDLASAEGDTTAEPPRFATSALDGRGVETSFASLARQLDAAPGDQDRR